MYFIYMFVILSLRMLYNFFFSLDIFIASGLQTTARAIFSKNHNIQKLKLAKKIMKIIITVRVIATEDQVVEKE
jgi:hypothetical protein